MKLIAIWFITLAEVITSCAFAQHKSLLLINSAKADTVTFVTGDHIKIYTKIFDAELKGRLNEINDSSLLVGNTLISLRSIHYMRGKNPPGMVIVKSIGATATVLGILTTFLIAAGHPTGSDNPHQQQQYEEDMQDYHKALLISGSITVFAATSLFIHNPKYYFNKGWRPYVYSPVEVPNADSVNTFTDEPRLKDSVSFYPYNHKISNNAAYLQFSTEITHSIFYDHLWKINNNLNLSSSAGIGKERYSDDIIIPISLGCVIGKKQHRIETGQMSWFAFNDSNPSLLGILAYRFQSFKGQIFFRGGMLITELSNHNHDHSIHPFCSIGMGF